MRNVTKFLAARRMEAFGVGAILVVLLGVYLTAHTNWGWVPLATIILFCVLMGGVYWPTKPARPIEPTPTKPPKRRLTSAIAGGGGVSVFAFNQEVTEEDGLAEFERCEADPENYGARTKECGCKYVTIRAYPMPPYTLFTIPCEQHRTKQATPA